MKCPDFEILMLMLDGELPAEQQKEVSDHVKSCRHCTGIVESQERIETSWRDGFKSPGDDQFRRFEQQVFDRMQHHSRRKWWTVIPIAASIVAVLLGVKLIISGKPSLESPPGYPMHAMEQNQIVAGHPEQMEDSSSHTIPDGESSVDSVISETPMETQANEASDISVDTDTHSRMSGAETTGWGAGSEISESASGIDLEMSPDAFTAVQEGHGLLGASAEAADDRHESLSGPAGGSGGVLLEDYGYEEAVSEEAEESLFYDEQNVFGDMTSSSESAGGELEQDAQETETVLSLDLDGTELETVSSVPASSTENRIAGAPILLRDSAKYLCVELVFDSNGIPDSMTALILDSLIPDWYLYIPFVFRDTTLIIQRDEIYEHFVNVNSTPACENE